jgi:periplasmic copper chaperone A
MRLMKTLVLVAGASLIVASAASAHVTLNPGNAPADSFSRFALRVPTEENVPTVKLSVQLPAELEEVGFQPKEGWKRTQNGRVVTWSGGQIGVGEFDEFGLSIHVPNTPGETLTFPATQTYANGKVVRWIGAPESDEPAPTLTIEAAESESPTPTTTTEATEATEATESEDDDDMESLALGFGIAGLAVGLLALGLTLVRKRKER